EDLDELDQHGDDQDKDDGLQVAQARRAKDEDLDGEGDGRRHEHDKDDRARHTQRGVQFFGDAQERADAKELHQHVVVDQDHAEEDSRKFNDHLLSSPSCRSFMGWQPILRSMRASSLPSTQMHRPISRPKQRKAPGAWVMMPMVTKPAGMSWKLCQVALFKKMLMVYMSSRVSV